MKPIKVALIGNMNNNFFAILRWLRDAGYNAHLFHRPLADHFLPKSDTFRLDWLQHCTEVHWVNDGFFPSRLDQQAIRQQFAGYDFFIGQGDLAALLYYCGIRMDIYFPYGSDFYKYAWQPHAYTWSQKALALVKRKSRHQPTFQDTKEATLSKYIFDTIKHARHVYFDASNPEYEKKLSDIGLEGTFRHIPMPFIYTREYEDHFHAASAPSVHWRNTVDVLRAKHDLLILYHGRQEWKSMVNAFTAKNTHYLIEGFAQFLQEKDANFRAHLIMLEYGTDVAASKALIEELGITASATWLPKMYRKDLMYLISQVDIGAGEFGRSYLTFGTIIENMALGKPVIHHRDDALYIDTYPTLYPLLNAKYPQEIKEALLAHYQKPDVLKAMGAEAQKWVQTYFIERPLEAIITLIEEKRGSMT